MAHDSAPTSNVAPGSPPGGVVSGGISPILPMFCDASARQTDDCPAHAHQKLTESFSRGGLPPPRTSYTSRSTSRCRRRGIAYRSVFMGKIRTPRSEMHKAKDRGYAAFRELPQETV
jgi:hypothetical protein